MGGIWTPKDELTFFSRELCREEGRGTGRIEASVRYQLKESPGSGHTQGTKWNHKDSDGRVIMRIRERLFSGSLKPRLGAFVDQVLMTPFTPSEDGKAWMVRLFGASGKTGKVKLAWANFAPQQVWLRDRSEKPRKKPARPSRCSAGALSPCSLSS